MASIAPMDSASQVELDRLLRLDPQTLTPEERAFLYARRDYLKESERKEYKSVLAAQEKSVEDAATFESNQKAEPTGEGAADEPKEDQADNDTAKQTPEKDSK